MLALLVMAGCGKEEPRVVGLAEEMSAVAAGEATLPAVETAAGQPGVE